MRESWEAGRQVGRDIEARREGGRHGGGLGDKQGECGHREEELVFSGSF
jgi:hypothetical protein